MKNNTLKRKIFEIIGSPESPGIASKIFDISIICLIILNVVTVIVETFKLSDWAVSALWYIEFISVIIFTIEYLLRLYVSDLLYPDMNPISARLRYISSFMAVIDLLAILPFYLPYLLPIDLRVLRMLRIFRLMRLFKLNRYTSAMKVIVNVFKRKKHELLSSLAVVSILMIMAAVIMYNIENEAQPEVFDNALAALWWSVATLTTVGYGDIYPVTALGKILSALIALLGIGLVAVPTGIISSGFIEDIEENRNHKKDEQSDDDKRCYCPYCGKKIK